ncbi:uncharacterized protein LOC117653435 [Thrips palmi]|uniref:Uncharacterized protein LOC117653435 n=1 Tax=Thrips palmi TaxID=161013 RepID=A0A6P9AA64_THRPL|nr:uncharacterized protein LOC117653435 [Thrips palmi]
MAQVARQAPGADILGHVTEAFQEHVAQKMQRMADFLGSLGIQVPVPNVAEALPTGIVSMAQQAAEEDASDS